MRATLPHFLLFSDLSGETNRPNCWRFILQSTSGRHYLAAEDVEPGHHPSRLELLAVVRGLEALDGPARVTLVTKSRYVRRGLRRCLGQWRARRWRWERFGQLVPIRDHDLWQRVDRALRFHEIDCLPWTDVEPGRECGRSLDGAVAATVGARRQRRIGRPPVDEHTALGDAGVIGSEAHTTESGQLAACVAEPTPCEPALVVVPRRVGAPRPNRASCRPFFRALERLRQNVLSPLAAVCRPAFTRAA